jgi:hypothetical protein
MVVKDGQEYQKFWGGGPSIDQKIAAHLKAAEPALPFESFTFAIDPQDSSSQSRISYREDGTTVALVDDPLDAFAELFALSGLDAQAIARLLAERKSMLDLVWNGELSRLRARVGADDRAKLDAHLEGWRALEQRLSTQAGQCAPPPTDLYAEEPEFVRKGKLDMDMLAVAFACGLTRVANIQWGYGTIPMSYPWAGCYSPHHDLSHNKPIGTTAEERTAESIKIGQFYASMLGHLLDRLSEYVEGDGTLLDNTLVLWTSEHGSEPPNSDGHSQLRMPFLLTGNLAGSLTTGRRVVFDARPHNDLFVTLCNAFGMEDVATFGNPDVCTGGLSGLLA